MWSICPALRPTIASVIPPSAPKVLISSGRSGVPLHGARPGLHRPGGIGDKITQATTSVASTVGSTAGLVISAPLAIVDGRTRDSLGDRLNSVGSGAVHSFGDITTVGGVTLY